MFKKVLHFLFCALLLSVSAAHAQEDFRPGYIVRLSGDTVRGLADYRGAARSSRLCEFRSAADAATSSYRPEELLAFGFPGEKEYRSCLTPLADSADKAVAPRLFFLEILADGAASLYSRRGRNDATFFYLQKGPFSTVPVKELVYRRVVVEVDGRKVFREINLFKNTLSEAFADCPELSLDVLRTQFMPSGLARIVNRYNECVGSQSQVKVIRKKAHFSIGAVGGVSVSKLVVKTGNSQASFGYNTSPSFEGGFALQYVSPALNEKLMLRLEFLYEKQEYKDEYRYSSYLADAMEQARIRLNYLRLPLVLRYTVPRGWLRPFAEAGVVASRALSTQAEYRVRYDSTMPYGEWSNYNLGNRQTETGLLAGVGAQMPGIAGRPFSVLARIERSNSVVGASNLWRYQLLLGMNLTK